MDKIEKFVDKWVEEKEPVKAEISSYDYCLDKSDLIHLVRDFSEQEWHTPDEKPKKQEGIQLSVKVDAYWVGVIGNPPMEMWFDRIYNKWYSQYTGYSKEECYFIWRYQIKPTEKDFKLLDK